MSTALDGLCRICRRRPTPDNRPSYTCKPCEDQMYLQLKHLHSATPLLAAVATTEPLANGTLNLTALDLTRPGNPAQPAPTNDDQIGHQPTARRLAHWAQRWTGRDIWSADTQSIAALLARNLHPACASQPDINLFAADLRAAYAQTRAALNRNLTPRRYPAPCDWCGQKHLTRPAGGEWIECRCGALYDETEYRHLERIAAIAAARAIWPCWALLTTRQAALYTGVQPVTIRLWTHRRWLKPDIGPWGAKRRYTRYALDLAQTRNTRKARP